MERFAQVYHKAVKPATGELPVYTYYVNNFALRRPRYYEEWVCGVRLLRVELPRRWNAGRVARVQHRVGVRGALNLPEPEKTGAEARLIATRALWQSCGAELALAALAQRGIEPLQAVAGVRAKRLSRPVLDALEQLSMRVQALALNLPDREGVALWLQRRCGIPVLEGEGDVTLCFFRSEAAPGRLLLDEERPQFPGLGLLAPGVEVPEGCPTEGLYAALWEHGRLPGGLRIVPVTEEKAETSEKKDGNENQKNEKRG